MNVWIDCEKERRPLYAEDSPIPLLVVGDGTTETSTHSIAELLQ